jgi:hypothetical protein
MKFIYHLFLFLIINSCSSPQSNLVEISNKSFGNNKITLAEIADDIRYIPFNDSIPIGTIHCLIINEDNIYLSVKDIGVVQFDRRGKYIRNLGHHGKGPGEYKYGMYFTVDKENKRIYILDRNKIVVYSKDGAFLKESAYSDYIDGTAGGIEMFGSLLFLPNYLVGGDQKFDWIFIDTLGRLVSKKVNSTPPFLPNFGLTGTTYIFENKLFYFNLFNDTIFSISSDFNAHAAYVFSKDIKRRPEKDKEATNILQLADLFVTDKMFETKKYIFLVYGYLSKAAILLIDKISKETFLAYKDVGESNTIRKTRPYIINDIDAGMPLNIRFTYYFVEHGEEYICSLIEPVDLKTYISSDEFKHAIPKYPEKKKELEKLATTLKVTDNPVLMMVRLKE